jgi:hypothetical protein
MTSIALHTTPRQERWAFYQGDAPTSGIVKHLAINLGAPGDRRDAAGKLWLALPRPGEDESWKRVYPRAFDFGQIVELQGGTPYRLNADSGPLAQAERPWLVSSGCLGPLSLRINVGKTPAQSRYRVQLIFAEPGGPADGCCVFDVIAGCRTSLENSDPGAESAKHFELIVDKGFIEIKLASKGGDAAPAPLLCGVHIEAIAE